jgi:hypothetical protein
MADEEMEKVITQSPTDATLTATGISLSELARERRSLAGREAARALPEFVEDIVQAEVSYTIDPRYLPTDFLDADTLMKLMHEAYGLTLAPLDLSPLTKGGQGELAALSQLSAQELVSRLFRANGAISFENGRFPTSPDDFVPLEGCLSTRRRYSQVYVGWVRLPICLRRP